MSVIAVEAPKITDWMQAWGSIAAGLTSVIAIVLTGRIIIGEIRTTRDANTRYREEQRDREAAQARGVVILAGDGHTTDYGGKNQFYYSEKVVNLSSAPILNVTMKVVSATNRSREDGLAGVEAVIPPGESAEFSSKWIDCNDGYSMRRTSIFDSKTGTMESHMFWDSTAWISVAYFTDATGLRWSREGQLPPRRVIES